MKPFIITIDGPSGVGKGTLATSLAEALNFIHLDTGAQYRAVTLAFLQSKKSFNEQTLIAIAENLTPEKLLPLIQDPQLRAPETSQLVSKVAHIKSVRVALTKLSQEFCLNPPQNAKGVVLDGRDTGTLVYPQANIKFFLTAESKVRAKRRWLDYQQKGIQRDFEEVFKEISERDRLDDENPHIPKPTSDMIHLDSSHLSRKEILDKALSYIL